ncbi:aminopeptidase N-like isoform X2 [Schistocerca cancellata]|uniref:aminopeptidase N-like isoform X2 n=1 Tax=Schistocerca cancellata TaxID=274614 RepID=UPI0021187362|nr:aminopeptidase N-like isoform X2 [Schistocerca cancellata]
MRSVWCLVVLTLLVTVAHGQDDRLPGESRPSSQRVDITVYRENEGERSFTFEGQTSVTVQVVRDTPQLVLHAAVNVSSLAVRYQMGDVIGSSYEQPQDGRDFLVVSLQEQVAEGSLLVLDIGFSANIGDREPGFSRYDYQGRDGQEAVYATQFMPNYARRALPCYDEPALKARYQLNMRTKPHLYFDSNTRNTADEYVDAEGFYGYYFEQTSPISAYQLSWVLHEMVGLVSSEDTSTVVWQVTSRSDQFGYASHMGPRSVAAMEQLVGVPYANYYIDKMDHIAVPGYIEEGVSCLGIITYTESSVLVDDDYTSEATKERVLGIMQHEAAHQWFGGLVSPSWWNDLWLIEGFASYFQWIAAALVQPSWQLRDVFVVNTVLQAAMPADVAPGSYPLSKSPNISVEQAFEEYFEEKGASIVWMIENIMGSEAFYRALNKYLTQNMDMDVWEDLLLAALDSESPASSLPEGGSLSSVVQPWLQQSGFPLISVSRNYSDGSAVISQAPYLSQVDAVWPVPISYTSRSEANYSATAPRLWLLDSELVVPAVAQPDDWLLLNMNVTGYYRVNYDEQNWALVTAQLLRDPLAVPAVARAQLLDDAASLAGAAQLLPAGTALQLASYLRFEYGYIPWRAVPGVLRNLELLIDEDAAENFKEFVLSLIHHMAILLRYHEQPGEDHTTRILRAVIVSIACNYGEPSCLNSMYEQLQHFMAAPGNSSNQVGPDLKRAVYCYGAQQGGEDAYNFLMDLYQTTDIVSELNDIVLGATCSQLVDGLRLLELTATGAKGGFRREHLQWLLEGLLQRRHTLPSALQFLSRGANLLSRPGEKQAARKLLRQAILEMRDDQLLEKVQQAAVALEDESLVAAAQWRRDVIANGAAARRDAARWLKGKPWRL